MKTKVFDILAGALLVLVYLLLSGLAGSMDSEVEPLAGEEFGAAAV